MTFGAEPEHVPTNGMFGKWDNYETWVVACWIEKSVHSRLYWLEQARKAKTKAENWWPDGNRTEEDQAVITLGEHLQGYFFKEAHSADASMPSQFILDELRHVGWFDIAHRLLAEIDQLGLKMPQDTVTDQSGSVGGQDSGKTDLHLPETVLTSIRAVIDYLWDDERRDYRARPDTDNTPHVFDDLRLVHGWLVEQEMLRGKR